MIGVCSKPDSLSFFFAPYGGVKPVEMAVTHLLRDTANGKQYFVFTPKHGSGRYFVREYLGDITEKRFFRVKSEAAFSEILNSLQSDGMAIERMDTYVAFDNWNN